uniref:DNA-directed RNA polymerase n=1 Tax=Haemonchus placei TaxID=6290 RepID=A0A0N4WDX0_HAEPC
LVSRMSLEKLISTKDSSVLFRYCYSSDSRPITKSSGIVRNVVDRMNGYLVLRRYNRVLPRELLHTHITGVNGC